jgi:2-C-methyl-D-erythritol 4-phosphate cytidylyltransferase
MKTSELITKLISNITKKDAAGRPFCSAVVLAAGNSTRMSGCNKQFYSLCGVPVLAYTLRNLDACESVHEIIVAARPEEIELVWALAREFGIRKLTRVVEGGATRLLSASRGADVRDKRAKLVAVHDGARPLGSPVMMARTIDLAAKTGAAFPAVPMKDTIKMLSPDGYIDHSPVRSLLRAAQTPQVFDADILVAAYAKAAKDGVDYTDDCACVEALGKRIYPAEGETTNIKITTPDDLVLARAILESMRETADV